MAQFTISLDPAAAALYLRVAQAPGHPEEEVLADALFKLAGQLSLEAHQPRTKQTDIRRCIQGRNLLY